MEFTYYYKPHSSGAEINEDTTINDPIWNRAVPLGSLICMPDNRVPKDPLFKEVTQDEALEAFGPGYIKSVQYPFEEDLLELSYKDVLAYLMSLRPDIKRKFISNTTYLYAEEVFEEFRRNEIPEEFKEWLERNQNETKRRSSIQQKS